MSLNIEAVWSRPLVALMRIFFVVCYVIFGVALSTVAGEQLLRAVHPDWLTTPLYQYDAVSLLVPRPNMSDRETNNLGAWGSDLNSSAETVLVFGDSNIEALFAKKEEIFPTQLAAALGSFQVANFGVRGYGPDQSVLRLEGLLRNHQQELGKVRAVVLQVFADNDLGDLLRNDLPEFSPRSGTSSRIQPDFTWFGMARNKYLSARVVLDSLSRFSIAKFLFPKNYYEPKSEADEFYQYKREIYPCVRRSL
jgi:hypothetical protein